MIDMRKEEEKKKTTSELTLGSNYELNKSLVKKYEKELTEEELKEKEKMLLEYIQEKENHYYMMLCHDRRDYTVFHSDCEIVPIFSDLLECLNNRGKIYGIDRTEDGVAIEIWLMIDEEAFCYYLFPYDEGVVEVFKYEQNS